MFYKKTIILILFICFFALGFNSVFAQEGPDFRRDIGAGKYSNCTLAEGKTNVYHCICQTINEVKDCQTGWLIPDPICSCCGDCTLNNFLFLGVALAEKILKYLGVFALLFFVIGGVIWITSGGSSEQVQKGKNMIKGAIIGIIIVFVSFSLVRIAMQALGTEDFLPDKGSEEQPSASWPECPVPPIAGKPWCYSCTWTGENRGCQSNIVEIYQDELNALGCDCGSVDGMFGNDTKACTERFQAANNLTVDGIVGEETYNALFQGMGLVSCSGTAPPENDTPPDYSCSEIFGSNYACLLEEDCLSETIKLGYCSDNLECCQSAILSCGESFGSNYACLPEENCLSGTIKPGYCGDNLECCQLDNRIQCAAYENYSCIEEEYCTEYEDPKSEEDINDCSEAGYKCCKFKQCNEWGPEYDCRSNTNLCSGQVSGMPSSDCGSGFCCEPLICESDVPGGFKCRDERVCGTLEVEDETDCDGLGLKCCIPSTNCADYAQLLSGYACRSRDLCRSDLIVEPTDCDSNTPCEYCCCLPD